MRVAVTGATGVLGRGAVRSLVAAGHDVVAMARDVQDAGPGAWTRCHTPGRRPVRPRVPLPAVRRRRSGLQPRDPRACRPRRRPAGAWRVNDRLRTRGVANVVAAAHRAGSAAWCRRACRSSTPTTATTGSPSRTRSTSPRHRAAGRGRVARAGLRAGPRVGVVLRFGTIVGDDPQTGSSSTPCATDARSASAVPRTGRTWCTPTTSALRCSPRCTRRAASTTSAPSRYAAATWSPASRRRPASSAPASSAPCCGGSPGRGRAAQPLAADLFGPLQLADRLGGDPPEFGVDWLDSWRSRVPEQTT